MWPTAPTAFSQPQTSTTAVHCGELISMKDCGLWATMTCKLSSNFFLARSPPLCLRRCGEGVVTGALKCSPNDQQLRGVRERRGEEEVGVSFANSVFLNLCLSVCIQCTWKLARCSVRLTIDYHPCLSLFCSSLSSSLFPLLCALLPGLSPLSVVYSWALWWFAPD